MQQTKNFNILAGIVFLLVSLTHLWLAMSGVELQVGETALGSWVSWLAFIVTGYMGVRALQIK